MDMGLGNFMLMLPNFLDIQNVMSKADYSELMLKISIFSMSLIVITAYTTQHTDKT